MAIDLRLDELLGSQNPSDTPSRETEALSKPIDNEDIILIHILDVLGGGDSSSVAVAGIVVARVELIANKGCAATADVLDLGQLGVGDHSTGRVTGVRGYNDGCTSRDFSSDHVRMDMVAILFRKRRGDGSELFVVRGT